MGQLYSYYLSRWNNDIGDTITLFNDVGGLAETGAFGQSDYIGQPLSETTRAKAVTLFLASISK